MKKSIWKKLSVLALTATIGLSSFTTAAVEAANRPTTMSPNGMVTAPHYLATAAALKTLEEGGNAVDAAIAAASTLAVVYPHYTSIGGDNFWLIYNAKTKEVRALNGSGRAGEKATIEYYKRKATKNSFPRVRVRQHGPWCRFRLVGSVQLRTQGIGWR